MASLDKMGAVLATKVLCDNIVVAEDVVVTLPDVEFITAEVKALETLPTALSALKGVLIASAIALADENAALFVRSVILAEMSKIGSIAFEIGKLLC